MSKQESAVTYKVKSAKTKKAKEGHTLEVVYQRLTKKPNGRVYKKTMAESSDELVHKDLKTSLKAFIPHFTMISENGSVNDYNGDYFKKKKFLKDPSKYEVTGVHIKEYNESMHVVLVGRQVLQSGRVISMTPPMVCYDPKEGDEEVYPFHKELKAAVDNYLSEVELYISEEKLGESSQMEADLQTPEEEPSEEEAEQENLSGKLRKIS